MARKKPDANHNGKPIDLTHGRETTIETDDSGKLKFVVHKRNRGRTVLRVTGAKSIKHGKS
jgi:hypothetical protein